MLKNRRRFYRPIGQRRYRKLFVIATEGSKTEPQYFAMLNNNQSIIRVECLRQTSKTSPLQVLRRMKDRLKSESLKKSDEAWLIVDKDQWTDEHLYLLHAWSQEHENYGFALSNPKFEYWLLLHFEDGEKISSSSACSNRLKVLPTMTKVLIIEN